MKNLLVTLTFAIMVLAISPASATPVLKDFKINEDIGRKILMKSQLRPSCRGVVFAIPQEKWKEAYESGKLFEYLKKMCPEAHKFDAKFEKYVFKFLHNHTVDNGNASA
jgi:DNA polymerase III delta subunit